MTISLQAHKIQKLKAIPLNIRSTVDTSALKHHDHGIWHMKRSPPNSNYDSNLGKIKVSKRNCDELFLGLRMSMSNLI